jgi:hypothetical protein
LRLYYVAAQRRWPAAQSRKDGIETDLMLNLLHKHL